MATVNRTMGRWKGKVGRRLTKTIQKGKAQMKFRLLVGLEHERIITKQSAFAHVKGQSQKEFPHDGLSCLAEVRSHPHYDTGQAVKSFLLEQSRVERLYNDQGMLLIHGEARLEKEFMALALEPEHKCETPDGLPANQIRGGGLHVHFSLHPLDGQGFVIQSKRVLILSCSQFIPHLVERLDKWLARFIRGESSYRKPGQWRSKAYGFEYRSCFWAGDIEELIHITTESHDCIRVICGQLLSGVTRGLGVEQWEVV